MSESRGRRPSYDHLPHLLAGASVAETARRLGLRESTIYERLKVQSPGLLAEIRAAERAAKARAAAENKALRAAARRAGREAVVADYLAGLPLADVLARNGYAPTAWPRIYRILRKAGVAARRRPDVAAKFAGGTK